MLQGSEYRIKNYFTWLNRSDDFRKIVKRRKLDYTKKAGLLLATVWVILSVIYVTVIALLMIAIIAINFTLGLIAVAMFVISPLFVSYLIVVPLWLGKKIVQEPSERKLVASAYRIFADHSALKIAIAGSYGKTTAKEILSTILSQGKKVASTPGNMNTMIGISRFAASLDGNEDIIVFELGEEKVGDVRDLCDLVQPDLGIITGINEAHLSSFGTLDMTVATIFELGDYLGDRPLYKNSESPLVSAKIINNDKLAFSRRGVNGWNVDKAETDISGTSFIIEKGSKTMFAHTGLLGLHNVGIIAAAIDIADSIGLTIPQITSGVKETKPFEHRMQPRRVDGAWILDDTYNGNSEGVQAGLRLLKSLGAKRRIYVTPGLVEQGDKNREVHEKMGQQIAEVADVVVLMQNSVTDYIANGLQKGKFDGRLIIVDDPLEFYTNINHFVVSGDVVLMQNDWTDNFA